MAFYLKTESASPKTHTRRFSCGSKNAYRRLQVKDPGSRFYSANLSRWISRDPIGERGGIDLYVHTMNNPVSGVDNLGLATYTKTDDMLAIYPNTQKDIEKNGSEYGKLTLDAVYIDASLADTLQGYDSALFNLMNNSVPGGFNGFAAAKFNLGAFAGSGFLMTFKRNKTSCCKQYVWRQKRGAYLMGYELGSTLYTDYEHDADKWKAGDFPGDLYGTFWNNDNWFDFKLRLLCIKDDGSEEQIFEIKWSSHVQILPQKTEPGSVPTVTLTFDW